MYLIRELTESDLPAVKRFTDQEIGENYYSLEELRLNYLKARKENIQCSFVLEDSESGKIVGLRLSYPPGNWAKGKGSKLRPDLWKIDLERAGYFQSLFLAPQVRGQGWGPKLSQASMQAMKKLGALAVVTHSWVESPGGSSGKYLRKIGFKPVIQHPKYWVDVDYVCTRDGKPCQCTAEEMILYF